MHNLRDDQPAPEILAPLDQDVLMWSASTYIFWPILWLPMLFYSKRDAEFLRFHWMQSTIFGAISSFIFLAVTGLVYFLFRSGGTTVGVSVVLLGLFAAWLFVFFVLFVLFLYFGYRAGRGDVFRIPLIGGFCESFILNRRANVE
jgi:uncharacterized membrane protein